MHAVPMMSEWGATDNVRALEIDAAVADENLMGWTHWAYKYWGDPTTADSDQGLFPDDPDLTSVKRDKVRPGADLAPRRRPGGRSRGVRRRVRRLPLRYRPDRRSPPPPGSSSARSTTRSGYAVRVAAAGWTKSEREERSRCVQPVDPL